MEGMGGDTEGLGFEIPPMTSQPRPMFVNYNAAGSPAQYGQPGSAPPDDSATTGNADEMNEAKRRRIARVRSH